MPDPYSPALAAALALAAAALAAAAATRLSGPKGRRPSDRLVRFARLGALLAAVALAIALGGHLAIGHRPGSPEALGPLEFVRVHPAPGAVALLVATALALQRRPPREPS